ncbi:acetyltransferase [Chitinophaga ginsengisegetis]|uniref:acetyltransferase n=1 Tax=Chitinophaga ginsengisegetis TaxID=393003 RepID=UPI000DBA5E7F|nr:acetyltransferase [Chitinophaga ginsengisegetis]MDR6570401.1 sugar O-acyltransferase (sialic acid O-acetyltransferase NeuD family) [Chitinophaga ginsengisegetis]MDR6650135.1 sugar O-acyltransferase (sialic acid O-acetyltransferase NeuD family) [Chitinophaga ginsengisegetis]MDR6656224.1 sugar O-acyltransferase (sialic acid O-acetyltransferase NeuD family) [Chitinophaga ginsengisegetis]
MKDIYILGAGGCAREVYFLITQIGQYNIRGFVDITARPGIMVGDQLVEIIGEDDLHQLNGVSLAVGIGNPQINKKLTDIFGEKFDFPNLIHPNVVADFRFISWGRGNIVTANSVFTTDVKIGSFNIFNQTTVGHDAEIGNCNVFNPSVTVSGFVKIGDTNLMGVKSTILESRTVGSNAIVGAAALVVKNVPDSVTVIGVPAVIK